MVSVQRVTSSYHVVAARCRTSASAYAPATAATCSMAWRRLKNENAYSVAHR